LQKSANLSSQIAKRVIARQRQQTTGAREGRYREYQFYGGAAALREYMGAEALLEGPFETGKTLAALQVLHERLWQYPGARGLIIRKTYKSLVQSAIVTYEKKILPVDVESSASLVKKYGGEKPEFYDYHNSSRLVCGGLDNADKVLSSEYDFIYINQLEEIDLDDYEKLTSRASGRAGNAPFAQVLGDCNPSYPTHWILQRERLKRFPQRHEHNPVLFNQETGELTEQGVITMATLDAMTGVRYLRGRKGIWAAAEGVIYDNWDALNVTEEAEYNPDLDVYWAVDDGYVYGQGPGTISYHPRVVLFMQATAIGGVNVFDEYYACHELSEVTIENCLAKPYSPPSVCYVDSSAAELKGRLWNKGIQTVGATHKVEEGIKNLRRMVCDGNGIRLFRIHPRCMNLNREMSSYRYDDDSHAASIGERKPLKVDDHGTDAARYGTFHFRYGN
jgi:phage terminase large subunit